MTTIKLTKFDAARRQLRTAIELWFSGGDPISIHALVYAAHEIIHRLYRRKGLSDLLFDTSLVQDKNLRNKINKIIKEFSNWIKHAERDSELDEIKEFDPIANDLFLMISVLGISRMDYSLTDVESSVTLWNFFHNRHWFPDNVPIDSIPPDHIKKLSGLSRDAFLPAFLEVWKEIGG